MVIFCEGTFQNDDLYQTYFNVFPFPLSDFQKWSIYAIINGHHSLITAHTGSGKTLPAEFAIEYFKEKQKKIIYTAPIKALCNQKLYDFKQKFSNISFGILTGDIKENPEADVIIMTTEILRNTLLKKQLNKKNNNLESSELLFDFDIETELGAVVFDEVHYICDEKRGNVWEQCLLLLPPQVQLIMLSATIEKPEIFAEWLENEKNSGLVEENKKKIFMTTTYERVVPLTHYLWTTCTPSVIKYHKDKPIGHKIREIIDKPLEIANSGGSFNELNYYKTYKLLEYFFKNNYTCNRQYVLNNVILYLKNHEMLPAICFIFSRKNVELAAKEITHTLFDTDDKTPNIIEHECEKILMLKLKNYREFMMLDEYRAIITLLKKGIAIHHAGILCILREMVELLFEKRYIKLLFATETFAVGINMPTKTVIFTQLSKYCDNIVRELLSHEYTQMAGRAGRRGIDTIGHVIHCNNLFKMPNINKYKMILTGPPKVLISQFKISYNLIFNIILANEDSEQQQIADKLICFMKKSFVQNDIIKEINFYNKLDKELDNKLDICRENLNNNSICKTPIDILKKYNELTSTIKIINNKQKKQLQKTINNIEYENDTIKNDMEYIITYNNLLEEKFKNEEFKTNAMNYIQNNINNIIKILNKNGFLESEYILTTKGLMALSIQEVHSLVLCDLYDKYNGFVDLCAKELTGLLSCFTNISIPQDMRLSTPGDTHINGKVKENAKYIGLLFDKYYDIEIEYQLNTGADYDIHYELIDYIIEWCDCENENKCINLIHRFKTEKNLFLGEFIKAIIKINNIVKELEKICEINNNISLLQKIKNIPELTLKYVVTNQSLYI